MKKSIQSKAANLTWKRTDVAMEDFGKSHPSFQTYRKGWPDFFGVNTETGTLCFIECKVMKEASKPLREDQEQVRKALGKISGRESNYEVWFFEDKKGSTRIVAKALYVGEKLSLYYPETGKIADKLLELPNFIKACA